LIGRSLRSITHLPALGERTVWIDCDVLQADGGTRTASITGAFVALALALETMRKRAQISTIPLSDYVRPSAWASWTVTASISPTTTTRARRRHEHRQDRERRVHRGRNGGGLPFGRDSLNLLLDLADLGIRNSSKNSGPSSAIF
jgi:hypothetical protein